MLRLDADTGITYRHEKLIAILFSLSHLLHELGHADGCLLLQVLLLIHFLERLISFLHVEHVSIMLVELASHLSLTILHERPTVTLNL